MEIPTIYSEDTDSLLQSPSHRQIMFLDATSAMIQPGPLFTKKAPSYQYRDSHYKPETVVRPS